MPDRNNALSIRATLLKRSTDLELQAGHNLFGDFLDRYNLKWAIARDQSSQVVFQKFVDELIIDTNFSLSSDTGTSSRRRGLFTLNVKNFLFDKRRCLIWYPTTTITEQTKTIWIKNIISRAFKLSKVSQFIDDWLTFLLSTPNYSGEFDFFPSLKTGNCKLFTSWQVNLIEGNWGNHQLKKIILFWGLVKSCQ